MNELVEEVLDSTQLRAMKVLDLILLELEPTADSRRIRRHFHKTRQRSIQTTPRTRTTPRAILTTRGAPFSNSLISHRANQTIRQLRCLRRLIFHPVFAVQLRIRGLRALRMARIGSKLYQGHEA